jgi:hypothetical protein
LSATVQEWKAGQWTGVKSVDVKLAIRRMGGDLPVADKDSYTTDSTGQAQADFKRDSIPGNEKGALTLVAKVEDNDQYGNLIQELSVPWGSKLKSETHFFDKRALWSARFRAPYWLMLIAYSIIVGVWTVMIYLAFQIFKIKKIGIAAES